MKIGYHGHPMGEKVYVVITYQVSSSLMLTKAMQGLQSRNEITKNSYTEVSM